VREDKQVLLHYQGQTTGHCKVEIFSPVLSLILGNQQAVDAIPVLKRADKTIFLLLNPLSKSIGSLDDPAKIIECEWKREQWMEIQEKRDIQKLEEAQKPATEINVKEINIRIDLLPVEAKAWQYFHKLAKDDPTRYGFVEAKGWEHFEHEYKGDVERRNKAAKSILEAAKEAHLEAELRQFINQEYGGDAD
jgi:hypothetical protein